MKKIVVLVTAILLSGYTFYEVFSKTKGLLNKSNPINIVETPKKYIGIIEKSNKKKDVVKAFNEVTTDVKQEIYRSCNRQFNSFDYSVNTYIDEYTKFNKQEPTDQQISAFNKHFTLCENYSDHSEELKTTFLNNKGFDKKTGQPIFSNKLLYTVKNESVVAAYKQAEENLFHVETSIRQASKTFINNKDWITTTNDALDIFGLGLNSSRTYLSSALDLRSCELGLYDCSANSINMLRACQNNQLVCGLGVRDSIYWDLRGFELENVEKYLTYLRTLGN